MIHLFSSSDIIIVTAVSPRNAAAGTIPEETALM
jgi:hypothetical protein